QVLSTTPTVIVDGAHNVHGVQALLKTLDKVYPERKLRFLISILADKDYREIIKLFCSKAAKVYIAQNQSDRAATAAAQAKAVSLHGVEHSCYESVALALQAALDECSPEDILVAGGSLYTAGEVISAYHTHA
ncbi:MAG TPA: cyanophycin synthetase, partial [Candidatus Cloacimonadota bacterium]|nr:cyanophycin synthetase [Candidatus Cloacimonadota bacterium]